MDESTTTRTTATTTLASSVNEFANLSMPTTGDSPQNDADFTTKPKQLPGESLAEFHKRRNALYSRRLYKKDAQYHL